MPTEDLRALGEHVFGDGGTGARSPASHDPRRARDRWLQNMAEFLQVVMPAELPRFWDMALKPKEEARPYLNRIDGAMKRSDWWQRRTALKRRRA